MSARSDERSVKLDDEAAGDDEGSLALGSELEGRYRVVKRVGCGGMGQVYEAQQLRLERRVAIKVLRSKFTGSKHLRKRFEREARAMAQIDSQHVVTIFDCGVGPSGEPYLVMEYLEGRSIGQLLKAEGPLAAPRAARLLHDACLGVASAHAKGVIHRDLKPENLFVIRRDDGLEMCKVLDLGLAKLRALSSSEVPTTVGVPLGTLHYMSPEQARGDDDLDERTDVYGACAVLYEMVTGQRVHSANSAHALIYKIIHDDPPRIEQLDAPVPPALALAIHRGLERERALRPATMQQLAQSLEPFLGKRERTGENSRDATSSAFDDPTRPPLSSEAGVAGSRSRMHPFALALLMGVAAGAGLAWVVGGRIRPGSSALEVVARPPSVTPPVAASARSAIAPSRQLFPTAPGLSAAPLGDPGLFTSSPPASASTQMRGSPPTPVRRAPTKSAALEPKTVHDVADDESPFVRSNPYD